MAMEPGEVKLLPGNHHQKPKSDDNNQRTDKKEDKRKANMPEVQSRVFSGRGSSRETGTSRVGVLELQIPDRGYTT